MTDLAMNLARAAAHRALAEAEAPQTLEPDATQTPEPGATQTNPLATPRPQTRTTTHTTTRTTPRAPTLPGVADPNLLFIQLCRCVRETIALEIRLADDQKALADEETKRRQGRALAAALNARFPQPAVKPAPVPASAPAPATAPEKPLWNAVLSDAHGPSG